MRTLVWAMIRLWRGLFPPYWQYWLYVDTGWFHEAKRWELAEEIRRQPFLRCDSQERMLVIYEHLRDVQWAKADELMVTPDWSEL